MNNQDQLNQGNKHSLSQLTSNLNQTPIRVVSKNQPSVSSHFQKAQGVESQLPQSFEQFQLGQVNQCFQPLQQKQLTRHNLLKIPIIIISKTLESIKFLLEKLNNNQNQSLESQSQNISQRKVMEQKSKSIQKNSFRVVQIKKKTQYQKQHDQKKKEDVQIEEITKRSSELEKDINYYKKKLKSFENQESLDNYQSSRRSKEKKQKQSMIKVQTEVQKTSIGKEKSNLSKNYEKILKLGKINPQLYQKNLRKRQNQAEQKLLSNIEFLNRIKGLSEQKEVIKEWKHQIKQDQKQFKSKKKQQKLLGLGFSMSDIRKQANPRLGSIVLPKIQTPSKKYQSYQLEKPIPFNLYNVNRRPHEMFYNN